MGGGGTALKLADEARCTSCYGVDAHGAQSIFEVFDDGLRLVALSFPYFLLNAACLSASASNLNFLKADTTSGFAAPRQRGAILADETEQSGGFVSQADKLRIVTVPAISRHGNEIRPGSKLPC